MTSKSHRTRSLKKIKADRPRDIMPLRGNGGKVRLGNKKGSLTYGGSNPDPSRKACNKREPW